MKRLIGHLGIIVLLLLPVCMVHAAPVPVLTDVVVPSYGIGDTSSDYTNGFEFSVDTNVIVTALGIYDDGNDGLAWTHQVGIWDITNPGTPIISDTVPAGTAATLVDNYRYIAIPEASRPTLLAGHTYRIGGETWGDPWIWAGTFSADSRITVTKDGVWKSLVPGTFGYPEKEVSGANYLTANFQIDAVPIPGAVWLLGSGLLGLVGIRKKLHK
ncbi:MAG: hypothetical protein JRI36_11885 [Deltaproteobacteria bacterium]|nr:hypothetical protein [Deltaproteobacteria bacterium]